MLACPLGRDSRKTTRAVTSSIPSPFSTYPSLLSPPIAFQNCLRPLREFPRTKYGCLEASDAPRQFSNVYNPKWLPRPVVALRQISQVPLISTTQWNDSEALPLRQQHPYSGLRECDEYTLATIRTRRGGFGPEGDLYSKARTSPELICPLKNTEPEFTLRIQVSIDEASIIVCFAPIPDQYR
ncbi:hypothetical protein ARMGADRAFT_1073911 [Armillaria gallica]|uniref:Uncharacterized protein n=1 Tax=Armillaria gallica TaxID=47427 RepID=A0A2H3DUU8_ARMGA|nr:hypothetical protein ARMGADRAFT_1073911 [Armillaria gallica]